MQELHMSADDCFKKNKNIIVIIISILVHIDRKILNHVFLFFFIFFFSENILCYNTIVYIIIQVIMIK